MRYTRSKKTLNKESIKKDYFQSGCFSFERSASPRGLAAFVFHKNTFVRPQSKFTVDFCLICAITGLCHLPKNGRGEFRTSGPDKLKNLKKVERVF